MCLRDYISDARLKELNQILLALREILRLRRSNGARFLYFSRENSLFRVSNARFISPRTSSRRGFTSRVPAANGILIAKSILNDRVIFDSWVALWSSFSEEEGREGRIYTYISGFGVTRYTRINIYQSSREHGGLRRFAKREPMFKRGGKIHGCLKTNRRRNFTPSLKWKLLFPFSFHSAWISNLNI